MKARSVVWLACLLAAASGARGEAPFVWPGAFDTVDVVAARPMSGARLAPARGFVQVVPLGPDAPAGADLGDLLTSAAGVTVRRMGGLGAMTLASVRGSSPSQVQVYIDDLPISTAGDAMANLSLLPVRLFDRMEIARGPLTGELEGGGAGSIRLVSPGRFDVPLRVRVAGGSFGTASVSGTAGGSRGPFHLYVAGGRLASRGDYPYLDRGGTMWESSDDRIVRRRNNAFRQEDLLLQARTDASHDVQIDYLGHGLWKRAGIPGTENIQTTHVRDRFRRWLQAVTVGSRDGPARSWKATAHRQDDVDRYRNPDGEVGLGRADTRSHLRAEGLDLAITRTVPPLGAIGRASGTLLRERWREEDLLRDVSSPTRERITKSAGLEGSLQAGRLGISAHERWLLTREWLDGVGGDRHRKLAQGRLGGSIDAGDGVVLRGGWGQMLRLPSFVELYGQGGVQEGNPGLLPERGVSWDVGADLRWAPASAVRASFEITAFENRTREAIVWIQNSQRTSRPQNLERTRVRGLEGLLRGSWRAGRGATLVLTATSTLQQARDDGPSAVYHGKQLPYQPSRRGSFETRLETGGFRFIHSIDSESGIYRDRYNSSANHRDARTLQDFDSTWKVPGRPLEISLAVRNLTDQRAQDVEGFPLPGRSFLAELTWTIR